MEVLVSEETVYTIRISQEEARFITALNVTESYWFDELRKKLLEKMPTKQQKRARKTDN